MKRFFNSIIIGISYVVPGVCSSTTANSLGEYNNIIEVTSNFYKPNVLRNHLVLILGIICGMIFSVIGLSLIIDSYINMILSIFLGLNIALFRFDKNIKNNIIYNLIGVCLVVVLSINFNINLNNNLLAFAISGLVVALGFVLPGLSGSLLMLSMGVYKDILLKINNLVNGSLEIDLSIIIFLMSIIVGIILWSKLLHRCILKNSEKFESLIKGMSLSGIVFLVYETFNGVSNWIYITVLMLLTIISFVCIKIIKRIR